MEIAKIANYFLNSSLEEFTASLTGTMFSNELETTALTGLKTKIIAYKNQQENPINGNALSYSENRMGNFITIFSKGNHTSSTDPVIQKNLHTCSKTSPCPCCGECASWKRDHTEFVHSKKNCPYIYFFLNICKLAFMNCDVKLQHKYNMTFTRIASNWFINKYKHLSQIESEMNIKIEEAGKFVADELNIVINDLTTKYEATNKELQLFHRIMPQDTIDKRREEYEMRKNEIETKENELVLKINETNDALEKLKIESGLTEINVEMRNIKIKNMQHKYNVMEENLKNENQVLLDDKVIKENQIKNLLKEKTELKRMNKIESEGYSEMEAMNEKMYSILKEQKKCPDENCCYCLSPIIDECMTLKCGHHFHSSCYMKDCLQKCRENKYLRTYKCPLCRGEAIVLNNY